MNKIKISTLWTGWTGNFTENLILKLMKNISKKEIEIVSPKESDILIFGPYDTLSLKRKIINFSRKKIRHIDNIFPNIDLYIASRKIKPIRIFYSHENYIFPNVKYDFSITSHFGLNDESHLRFPLWKELINWSHIGLKRKPGAFVKRFDTFYNIQDLMLPQGDFFLKKARKICLLSSHLDEPRRSMLNNFSKNFIVDGYGPYFNKNIKNHNFNPSSKKEILKKYAFNLCPENSLYPGYYTEKVPEAFLSKCLPLAWADNNIAQDFNVKSFVNLLNYSKDNYMEINNLLKDESFLNKYTNEPLILKEPNLNKEINFIKKITDLI
jgi:hypothetical protein